MAAPRAVEERRLVDDVGSGRHRGPGLGRRGPQLVAAILDRSVELDGHRGPARRLQLGQIAAARARTRASG